MRVAPMVVAEAGSAWCNCLLAVPMRESCIAPGDLNVAGAGVRIKR